MTPYTEGPDSYSNITEQPERMFVVYKLILLLRIALPCLCINRELYFQN